NHRGLPAKRPACKIHSTTFRSHQPLNSRFRWNHQIMGSNPVCHIPSQASFHLQGYNSIVSSSFYFVESVKTLQLHLLKRWLSSDKAQDKMPQHFPGPNLSESRG